MNDTLGRRLRAAVAGVWIACRVAALVATPVAVWIDATGAAASECHCAHGADATCPMHHKSAAGTRVCAMQATGDWATAAVESMLGESAPPAPYVAIDHARAFQRVSAIGAASISLPAVPPEPPPPRA